MPKQVFAHRVQLEIISTGNFKRIILHITLIPWKDSVHLAWITVMPAVDRQIAHAVVTTIVINIAKVLKDILVFY